MYGLDGWQEMSRFPSLTTDWGEIRWAKCTVTNHAQVVQQPTFVCVWMNVLAVFVRSVSLRWLSGRGIRDWLILSDLYTHTHRHAIHTHTHIHIIAKSASTHTRT